MEWKDLGAILFTITIMLPTLICLMCFCQLCVSRCRWRLNFCKNCYRSPITLSVQDPVHNPLSVHPSIPRYNIHTIEPPFIRYIVASNRHTLPPVVLSIDTLPTYEEVTEELPSYDEAVRCKITQIG